MNGETFALEGRVEGYRLTVSLGQPAAPDGLTRVRLEGTGRIEAEQTVEGGGEEEKAQERPARQRAAGDLSRDRVERLMYQASLLPWERRFPSRPGIPDEAILEITLQREGGEPQSLRVWLREAEQDPAVGPLLEELREELARISEGRIYL